MEKSATLKELLVGLSPHEKIFAVDYKEDGRKYFLRGRRSDYVNAYDRAVERKCAHWYEVILTDRPCPIVLDIESTEKKWAETLNSVREFLKLVTIAVDSKTHVKDEFYYLDSSKEGKVSFHIIGSVFFTNLAHVGALVRALWAAIQSMLMHEFPVPEGLDMKRIKYLFESNGEWIIDDCIYTRNRLFRLPLSSKKGSNRVLMPVKNHGATPDHWIDMLVQRPHDKVFNCMEICNSEPIFTSTPASKCLRKIGKNNWEISEKKRQSYQTASSAVPPYLVPVLDKLDSMGYMVKRDIMFNSARRSWCVSTNSRKCAIAGREHGSNHIWFEIDGFGGKVLQRCYDSECHGFKEVDVGEAWDQWTLTWTTMVDVTEILNSIYST